MSGVRLAVAAAVTLLTAAGLAAAEDDFVRFPRSPCTSTASPPPFHCPDAGCDPATIVYPGATVEMESRRTYFLDYPCDLARGEKVTFVLSLHGGGSYANWQRHYFPLLDFVEQYRLVVATPSSPIQVWTEADDEYLQNIVESVYEELGAENVKSFWLVGHSQGGQTANRLLASDFFAERLAGWLSLSGGRLGSKREEVRARIPRRASAATRPGPSSGSGRPRLGLTADASILPDYPFSHIYSSGEHELTEAGLPPDSRWAQKLGCGPQTRLEDVVDARAGYVYDTREQANRNPIWGLDPRPGKAAVYVYPDCDGGRVVADVIRLDKGHTEGFEPRVTEAILDLMMQAAR